MQQWGARPEDPAWDFTSEDFPWNALGQQWTLTWVARLVFPNIQRLRCSAAHYVIFAL